MKRNVLACIIIYIAFCFWGCNVNTGLQNDDKGAQYTVVVYGYSDSAKFVNHEKEYEFGDFEKYNAHKAQERVIVKIGEKEIQGEYVGTDYIGTNTFPTYEYRDEQNNLFAIDPEGRLVFYFWGEEEKSGEMISQEEAEQIAKDFLGDIVDVSPYQIDVTKDDKAENYTVEFKKYVDGMETTDCATIRVQYSGELYSYSSFMLGTVSEDVTNNFDMNDVENAIVNRLDQVFEASKEEYDRVEYGTPTISLTMLKDGSVGLVCYVDMECIDEVGVYEAITSERINMVITE